MAVESTALTASFLLSHLMGRIGFDSFIAPGGIIGFGVIAPYELIGFGDMEMTGQRR